MKVFSFYKAFIEKLSTIMPLILILSIIEKIEPYSFILEHRSGRGTMKHYNFTKKYFTDDCCHVDVVSRS